MVVRDGRSKPTVGLFITCLANLFSPRVGFAAVKLLEDAGCTVEVPSTQSCCGQPAYNSGDFESTRAIARGVIDTFEAVDYVVAPSGSCIATLKNDYPKLFADVPQWSVRANALAARSFELMSFLIDVLGYSNISAQYEGLVTYHDSCSGLRSLGVKRQPRALLAGVRGLQLTEMRDAEVCCGFGGTFCVKYPAISQRMVDDKIVSIEAAQADTLVGGDLGCLMNIAGRMNRLGKAIRVFHTAEVLAGMASDSGLGKRRQR